MQKLNLKIKQIRELRERFGIKNLIMPSEDDKLAIFNDDCLVAIAVEGSKGWDTPLTVETASDMNPREIAELVQSVWA